MNRTEGQGAESLITAREAAAYLRVSLSTLQRIEQEGYILPYRTPGGHRRYSRHMVDAYLESTRRRQEVQSEPVVF